MEKIAVYTICQNEEKHVLQWLENVQDADLILVGDTGSTDNSTRLLEANGAEVIALRVFPWRFDQARNQLLGHIPEDIDICISLDFDERLSDGWREQIEKAWNSGVNRLSYRYSEAQGENPDAPVTIVSSRIHSRKDYQWRYPVHELLLYCGPDQEKQGHLSRLEITHRPDEAKSRSQYLGLMELAAEENPKDLRIIHHLGRDYMQHGLLDQCIETMQYNLTLPQLPEDQKRACLRFIARAYGEKQEYRKAADQLIALIDQAPYCSAAYVEHGILSYKYGRWDDIAALEKRCQAINFQYHSVYNEFAGRESVLFDIISMACYQRSDIKLALHYAGAALARDQQNARLQQNVECFQGLLRAPGGKG